MRNWEQEQQASVTRIKELKAALIWTLDNSKLLESAFPVPSFVLNTWRSLGHSQSTSQAEPPAGEAA